MCSTSHVPEQRHCFYGTQCPIVMWIISGVNAALERVMCIISGATASLECVMLTILGATAAMERVMWTM